MTPAFNSNPRDCSSPVIPVFSPSLNLGTEFLKTLPTPTPIAKNTVLLHQHQRPEFVHVVCAGILKLTHDSKEGVESLLGLRSEGWWAGAAVALMNVSSLVTVTTLTKCTIASVPVSDFFQILIGNHRMLRHFLISQSKEIMVEHMHGIMSTCSASARLDHLEREAESSAWQVADPSAVMGQGEIAQLLAVTPEHLSRLKHSSRSGTRPVLTSARRGRNQNYPPRVSPEAAGKRDSLPNHS